jgi:hypothetical protein
MTELVQIEARVDARLSDEAWLLETQRRVILPMPEVPDEEDDSQQHSEFWQREAMHWSPGESEPE